MISLREGFTQVPAVVFGCLLPGELRLDLFPDNGFAEEIYIEAPTELIPPELRMPNTPLYLELDENLEIVSVWKREGEI